MSSPIDEGPRTIAAVDASPPSPERWVRGALPIVLGHRGARDVALENTLHAFEQARLQGAAGSELDVQLSADDRAYVFHDLDLRRVTDGAHHARIVDLQSTEIDAIRLPGDQPIPRLEHVLEWAAEFDMLLNIELKSIRPLRDPVAKVVSDLLNDDPDSRSRTLVSSFHPWLVRAFRRMNHHVPVGLIVSGRHRCLVRRGWPKALGCQAVHPQASLLLERPATLAPLSGLLINTWTVNDGEQARQLTKLGVNAIISDCPGKIRAAISNE